MATKEEKNRKELFIAAGAHERERGQDEEDGFARVLGDIVVVDTSNRNPSESQVAVCELNGEYTLKRFRKRGDEGWLVPANPEFSEVHVTKDDEFAIWGVVKYVVHEA